MAVKIWAHRGASGYEPENTIESFSKAIEMKADGIELDVQLTKDGEMIVIHDERVDRTSDSVGYVRDFSFEEIRKLDVSKPIENYGKSVKIPTLREVFELVKDTGLTVNVEVKNGIFPYPGIEEKVMDLISEMGMTERVWISSFNHNTVVRIKKEMPELKCGFLFADVMVDPYNYAKDLGMDALHPGIFHFLHDENIITKSHEKGMEVHVWTVNEKEHMQMLIAKEVDALITNYPDVARSEYSNLS